MDRIETIAGALGPQDWLVVIAAPGRRGPATSRGRPITEGRPPAGNEGFSESERTGRSEPQTTARRRRTPEPIAGWRAATESIGPRDRHARGVCLLPRAISRAMGESPAGVERASSNVPPRDRNERRSNPPLQDAGNPYAEGAGDRREIASGWGRVVVKGPGMASLSVVPWNPRHAPESWSVLDIAPTLLNLRGFPTSRDMEGQVRVSFLGSSWQVFLRPRVIETYGNSPLPSVPFSETSSEEETLERLRSLGYLK